MKKLKSVSILFLTFVVLLLSDFYINPKYVQKAPFISN